MLRQLKNIDSPVADIFADFFAQFGEPYAEHLAAHLSRLTMPEVTWMIVSRVLPFWSAEAVGHFRGSLGMLMSATDFWGTDFWCIRLLAKHQLIEQSSLEGWLGFKQSRLRTLTLMASEVATELELRK